MNALAPWVELSVSRGLQQDHLACEGDTVADRGNMIHRTCWCNGQCVCLCMSAGSWPRAETTSQEGGKPIPALSHIAKIPESPKPSPVYRDLDSVSTSYSDLCSISTSPPGPRFRLHPLLRPGLRLHLLTRSWAQIPLFTGTWAQAQRLGRKGCLSASLGRTMQQGAGESGSSGHQGYKL